MPFILNVLSHFVTSFQNSLPPSHLNPGEEMLLMYMKKKFGAERKTLVMGSALHEPMAELNARTMVSPPWNVVVWDDPVNLAAYVVWVFRRVFGYSEEKAYSLMQKVDMTGRSVVWSGERERCEMYVQQMHRYQLRATLEKDGKAES